MYIITLKFSENKNLASEYMASHRDWIEEGFKEYNFLLVGSIKPSLGGVIIAHNTAKDTLETFVQKDPFVIQNVVTAEILEVSPARTADSLAFLAKS